MKTLFYTIVIFLATYSIGEANTWQGTIDSNWNNAGNWSDGKVPDADTDVNIPNVVNDPLIDLGDPAVCRNLGLGSGAYLTVADTLTVYQDMNINGHIDVPHADSIYVHGDVDWRAGSQAIISSWSHFYVYGDWQFYEGSNVEGINKGVVEFLGSSNSFIISHEANSQFYNLTISKTDGAKVIIADWSTDTLNIKNDLKISNNSFLSCTASIPTVVNGDFLNFYNGDFLFEAGTVVMTGILPEIFCYEGRFHNITIQSSAKLKTDLKMDGDLLIDSGSLNAQFHDIEIKGDWTNNTGDPGTFAGDFGTVTFRGPDSTITAIGDQFFYDLAVSGYVSPPISAGVTIAEGNTIYVENNLNINYLGVMNVPKGAQLGAANEINVNFGGSLKGSGESGNYAYLGGLGGTYPRPAFNINSNGSLAAEYVIFQYLDVHGVNVKDQSLISSQYPFNNCTFRFGSPGGTMLTVDNSQELTSDNVTFSENTWNGNYNVTKNTDQGQIKFTNFSGIFSGPEYENDPYQRVLWGEGPHDITNNLPSLPLLLLND